MTARLPDPVRTRCALLALALLPSSPTFAADEGLLFHLSGDHRVIADLAAAGTAEPNFVRDVEPVADGAHGGALRCANTQLLSYWAPGNIYAQRGTLGFFWRSRDPVGPTEFPIFRVGYADHSSWDMVWLRIDYNGHGFDAFVTDSGLARTRVSVNEQPFPAPNQWTHLALAWDETRGIRFFVNGRLAGAQETTALYDAGLDQFGPHSRIISPYQVQSDYNFVRGGDIDEVRIYDRLLDDASVAQLAHGETLEKLAPLPPRDLADPRWRDEWWWRHGWNRPDDPPPYLAAAATTVRKVEIHGAYDLKRWWWKACDGIRETTWPGVYNRSRLPGRNDYFQLPDWDCYSTSGQSITFTLPDEPWNHVEISGPAWGTLSSSEGTQFTRAKGQERTFLRLQREHVGNRLAFTNAEQETPIGEFEVLHVTPGDIPERSSVVSMRLTQTFGIEKPRSLEEFTAGRHPPDERATVVALPDISFGGRLPAPPRAVAPDSLPIVHILIPNDGSLPDGGLDGIAIRLPALAVKPTHGALFPMNIRVKDPLWPARDMLDFSFSVKPGEPRQLWLDLRDRILPAGKPLYLTITGAGPDFGAAALEGAEIGLVLKPRDAARAEHELDRFTQARDAYAMLVEEHPRSPKFNLWNRFKGDLEDLLRVNPDHVPGRNYAALALPDAPRPAFTQPEPAPGVPLWAFRQVEVLQRAQRFVNWYIDNRQIDDGEFGGGISDDTDLTNLWPGVALMGCDPEKIGGSVRRLLDAAYANGMFTRGLSTIQTDELHSYEEGINCLGQNLILDFGQPRQIERAMETARGLESITGVNAAGHRHIRTAYYSGSKVAEEGVWGWAKAYAYLALQPAQLLVDYNGQPQAQKFLLELADGLLAHRRQKPDGGFELPSAIEFATDRDGEASRRYFSWPLFWTAWQWTGRRTYLEPIFDGGTASIQSLNADALDVLALREEWGPRILAGEAGRPTDGLARGARRPAPGSDFRSSAAAHFAWQLTGDKTELEKLYATQIEAIELAHYINTEGSLWIDRVGVPTAEIQRARLGGVALVRNATFPGHAVSWRFAAPASARSVAILIPEATRTRLKVIVFNLEPSPVTASMTGWNIDPGIWEVAQGLDTNGDDIADAKQVRRTERFERSRSLTLTFAPRATTVLTLQLKSPGQPYWERPDLGIAREDVVMRNGAVRVTVHSLGARPTPPARLVLRARDGKILATGSIPPLPAPLDLRPKTAEVALPVPEGSDPAGASIELDPDESIVEITRLNNVVPL